MHNNNTSKIAYVLMLMIVTSAFILRVKNVWFGYPLPVHPDEPILVNSALGILTTGDLNPHNFYYPSFNIYLQAIIFYIITLPQKLFGVPHWPSQIIDYYICGRIINVIFSTVTIYFVFYIGTLLIDVWAGLAATFFIAASSLHVTNSYYATVDTPTAFWYTVACLMAVLIYTKGNKSWYYIVGGISVGLAIGSKYTAFPSFIPILIAHISHARHDKNWFSKNIALSLIAVPVTFLITTPYALLDANTFMNYIIHQHQEYLNHPGATSYAKSSLTLYITYLFTEGYGGLSLILALLGAIYLFIKDKAKALLLISSPVALVLFLGLYPVYFPRNIMPVVPFISLLSGYSIRQGAELAKQFFLSRGTLQQRRFVMLTCGIVLIFISIQHQIRTDVKLLHENSLPDTRWISLQWIQGNIPAGAIIGREHYTPPIEEYSNNYKVFLLDYFGVLKYFNKMSSLDFMVVSDGDYSRFIDNPREYPNEFRIYTTFFTTNELIKEFNGDGNTLSGPTIRIYKIKHG